MIILIWSKKMISQAIMAGFYLIIGRYYQDIFWIFIALTITAQNCPLVPRIKVFKC